MVLTPETTFKTFICLLLLEGIVCLYAVSGSFNSCFNQMDFLGSFGYEKNP